MVHRLRSLVLGAVIALEVSSCAATSEYVSQHPEIADVASTCIAVAVDLAVNSPSATNVLEAAIECAEKIVSGQLLDETKVQIAKRMKTDHTIENVRQARATKEFMKSSKVAPSEPHSMLSPDSVTQDHLIAALTFGQDEHCAD
jgi:hypothetical protein